MIANPKDSTNRRAGEAPEWVLHAEDKSEGATVPTVGERWWPSRDNATPLQRTAAFRLSDLIKGIAETWLLDWQQRRAEQRWKQHEWERRVLEDAARKRWLADAEKQEAEERKWHKAIAHLERKAQEEAEAAKQRAAAEVAAKRARDHACDQWIAGEIRWFEHREHYQDSEWLTAYATKNMTKLIGRADEISELWNDYHEEHGGWIETLKKRSPETYERAKWEVRALAIAEQIAVKPALTLAVSIPTPRRRKETPKQYTARQRRHQRNKVNQMLSRAEDYRRAKAELDALGLEMDDYDRRLAALNDTYAEPDHEEETYNAKKL